MVTSSLDKPPLFPSVSAPRTNSQTHPSLSPNSHISNLVPDPPTVSPPSPQDITDAGTTIASLRTSPRYTSHSDLELDLLARDMQREKRALEEYIEKGRLMEHWQGIVAGAKDSVKQDREHELERMRLRKQRELLRNNHTAAGADGRSGEKGMVMNGY